MDLRVVRKDGSHCLSGGPIDELANGYLAHLVSRGFSPGTVRGYAFDLLNSGRFLVERRTPALEVVATDPFDYFDWQAKPNAPAAAKVVKISAGHGAGPGDDEQADRRGAGHVRVRGDHRRSRRQPGAGRAAGDGAATPGPRTARPHRSPQSADRWPPGPPAQTTARER